LHGKNDFAEISKKLDRSENNFVRKRKREREREIYIEICRNI